MKEFHAILLTNGKFYSFTVINEIPGLLIPYFCIANIDLIHFDVHPLCHISLLTSPGYLHETYIFLKRVISAAYGGPSGE